MGLPGNGATLGEVDSSLGSQGQVPFQVPHVPQLAAEGLPDPHSGPSSAPERSSSERGAPHPMLPSEEAPQAPGAHRGGAVDLIVSTEACLSLGHAVDGTFLDSDQ